VASIGAWHLPKSPSLGDAAIAIRFTRLVLSRYESKVDGDLAAIFEAMRIVDAGNEDLGCPRANAWNGSETDDPRVILADQF